MKILINEANREEIQKMISDCRNGREQNHLLDADDIFEASKFAELQTRRLLKKHLKGMRFFYSTNSEKAKAYKHSYNADVAILEFSKKGWVLIEVARTKFYPNQSCISKFYFEGVKDIEKRKREIADHLLNLFLKTN